MKYTIKNIRWLLLLIAYVGYTQDGAVAITGGVTQRGYGSVLSYNYYSDRYKTDFFQGSVFISLSKQKYNEDISIPYSDFTFNLGYYKNVFENRSGAFKVALGVGGVFGYEAVNNGSNDLSNGALITSKSGFVYGGFAGIDTDIFLSDQFSLVIKANEYYHINSTLGGFMPYAGCGLRIFLDY